MRSWPISCYDTITYVDISVTNIQNSERDLLGDLPKRKEWHSIDRSVRRDPHDEFWQSFTIIHPVRLYSSDIRNWIKGPTNTRTHTHPQAALYIISEMGPCSPPNPHTSVGLSWYGITVAQSVHRMLNGLHTDRRADIYKEMKFKSKFDKL